MRSSEEVDREVRGIERISRRVFLLLKIEENSSKDMGVHVRFQTWKFQENREHWMFGYGQIFGRAVGVGDDDMTDLPGSLSFSELGILVHEIMENVGVDFVAEFSGKSFHD